MQNPAQSQLPQNPAPEHQKVSSDILKVTGKETKAEIMKAYKDVVKQYEENVKSIP